jgi:hypothetical protein
LLYLNFKGNLFLIGSLIFSYNFILFIILGLILFVAMICSIVLLVGWDLEKTSKNKNVYFDSYYFSKKKIFFLK